MLLLYTSSLQFPPYLLPTNRWEHTPMTVDTGVLLCGHTNTVLEMGSQVEGKRQNEKDSEMKERRVG